MKNFLRQKFNYECNVLENPTINGIQEAIHQALS
jgi:hypothetical protein